MGERRVRGTGEEGESEGRRNKAMTVQITVKRKPMENHYNQQQHYKKQ